VSGQSADDLIDTAFAVLDIADLDAQAGAFGEVTLRDTLDLKLEVIRTVRIDDSAGSCHDNLLCFTSNGF
jgi:hypothetical protein